ncbi:MAG TPA: hypothetical protein VJQ54_02070 [Candidatus Sulfotelmatobacter sp.]|nr:hypothetical protein [Candidatus Sulfotelmatobacter sp.]
MGKTSLQIAIEKLAIAGEQAGLSVDQMIYLLSSGLTVATLLDLIAWRLEYMGSNVPAVASVYNWIM